MKLQELLDELEEATKRLTLSEQAEQSARTDAMQVRNEVNNIQKSIDAAIEKMKGNASWNTNWHGERMRKDRVCITPGTT